MSLINKKFFLLKKSKTYNLIFFLILGLIFGLRVIERYKEKAFVIFQSFMDFDSQFLDFAPKNYQYFLQPLS